MIRLRNKLVLCLSIAALFFIYLVLGVAMMKSYPVFADMSQVSAIAEETGGDGGSDSAPSAPQNVDYSPSSSTSTSSESSSDAGNTGAGVTETGSEGATDIPEDNSGSTDASTAGGDSAAITESGDSNTDENSGVASNTGTAAGSNEPENSKIKHRSRFLAQLSNIMNRIYQMSSSLFGFGSQTKKERERKGFLFRAERFVANAVPATAESLGLNELIEEPNEQAEGTENGNIEQPVDNAESSIGTQAAEDEGVQFQSMRMIGFGIEKTVETPEGVYRLELTNDGTPVTIEQMSAKEGVLAAEKLAIGDTVVPGSVETDKPGELINLLQQASIIKAAEEAAPDNPEEAVSQVTASDTVTGQQFELETNNFSASRIRIPNLCLRYTKVSGSESTE